MWGRAETGSGSGSGVVAMLPAAVRERVAAVHGAAALPELLRLYDGWAARYEQDVAALQYRAPVLAAAALAAALPGPPGAARVLDVCCGTGLVAREVPAATGLGRWGGTGRDGNRGAGAREVPVRFGARSPVPSAPRPAAAAARVRAPRRRGRQRGDAGAGTGRGAVPGAAALRAGLGTAARARRALRRRHRGGGPGRGAGAQRGRDRAAACHPARRHPVPDDTEQPLQPAVQSRAGGHAGAAGVSGSLGEGAGTGGGSLGEGHLRGGEHPGHRLHLRGGLHLSEMPCPLASRELRANVGLRRVGCSSQAGGGVCPCPHVLRHISHLPPSPSPSLLPFLDVVPQGLGVPVPIVGAALLLAPPICPHHCPLGSCRPWLLPSHSWLCNKPRACFACFACLVLFVQRWGWGCAGEGSKDSGRGDLASLQGPLPPLVRSEELWELSVPPCTSWHILLASVSLLGGCVGECYG
ncbi:methyltransferase-like protein 27 isoform X1 [Cuculus canorus]|uniref:methyltransferase-like protein 27 isoform X1 n=1 Tax=Cuculus canorus TaxID=55661 RepID=UPI0023AB350E|nr:methyltransferase-like protein 27 isoform X1 [Cuculus canorus]